MEADDEFSLLNLERCSYRFLQQTAKALRLPSNVKKIYLIQLIYTQKYGSQEDIDGLVKQVRLERQQQALVRRKAMRRKKHVQSTEISSTSNSYSPPYTKTPKRVSHVVIRYSPENYSPGKYPRTMPSRTYPLAASDRVLRSSNRIKKPSYILNNSLISLYKASDTEERSETTVNIVSKEKYRKFNRTYVRRKSNDGWRNGCELVPVRKSLNASSQTPARRQRRLSGIYPLNPQDIKLPSVSVRRADGTLSTLKAIIQKPLAPQNYNYYRQANRNHSLLSIEASQRPHTESNISEIQTNMAFRTPTITEIAQSLGYKGPDILSEIVPSMNYKASHMSEIVPSLEYKESNITEIIAKLNCKRPNISDTTTNMDYRTTNKSENEQSSSYRPPDVSEQSPNIGYRAANTSFADIPRSFNYNSSEESSHPNTYKDNNSEEYSVYYHKKIRAEQVRSLRSKETAKCVNSDCQLPKIGEVFSKFSTVYCRDVTHPIYVQVDSEPEIAPNPYIPSPHVEQSSSLEKLYNVKTYQPLLQIATTTNTRTVYSTPVISTPKAQPSTAVHNIYNVASPRDSQPYFTDEEIPRVQDFFRNFRCDDVNIHDASTVDFRSSSSSMETVTTQEQDLGANVTIPEMVEDALELISQDGDYMERMGMDIRMQCILCNWAGPKIILEYHVRKEHSNDIVECTTNEWCATYTLGGLAERQTWFSRLLEHSGTIYVLSAKYEDPDYFIASLSMLSSDEDSPRSGSMTIYNKVTGEPFTWQGDIIDLPPTMPYDDSPHCFRLKLSRMNLLPNSANLQLLNRELVTHLPNNVVIGQPELDDIHISLIVKILD